MQVWIKIKKKTITWWWVSEWNAVRILFFGRVRNDRIKWGKKLHKNFKWIPNRKNKTRRKKKKQKTNEEILNNFPIHKSSDSHPGNIPEISPKRLDSLEHKDNPFETRTTTQHDSPARPHASSPRPRSSDGSRIEGPRIPADKGRSEENEGELSFAGWRAKGLQVPRNAKVKSFLCGSCEISSQLLNGRCKSVLDNPTCSDILGRIPRAYREQMFRTYVITGIY